MLHSVKGLASSASRGRRWQFLKAATPPCRSFFFGGGAPPKKGGNGREDDESGGARGNGDGGEGSALILPQTGDNAPRLGNLLGLPVRRPVFPGLMSAAIVKDERVIDGIIKSSESGIAYLGTFLRADAAADGPPELITRSDQIHKVGTFVQIQSIIRIDQGLQLLLMGHRRVNLEEVTAFGPPLSVKVNHWKKPVLVESTAVKAYRNELLLAVRCVLAPAWWWSLRTLPHPVCPLSPTSSSASCSSSTPWRRNTPRSGSLASSSPTASSWRTSPRPSPRRTRRSCRACWRRRTLR